jgi:hypothetical protein
MNAICEEIPTDNETVTRTLVRLPPRPRKRQRCIAAADVAAAIQDGDGVYDRGDYVLAWNDRCYGNDCPPVCPYKAGNVRMIVQDKRYPSSEAASAVCARYGWTLLDLISSLVPQTTLLFKNCLGGESTAAYIRSSNGIGATVWSCGTKIFTVRAPSSFRSTRNRVSLQ